MTRVVRTVTLMILAALLGACAHPISIVPDLSMLPAAKPTVQKEVAFVVTEADRNREVTTPGGGGDSVRYFPYKELESGFFQMLSMIYAKVTLLRAAPDKTGAGNEKTALIFVPVVTTESSSSSAFTWPPTDFGITIKYEVQDSGGKAVFANEVRGSGHATFGEFKNDFGLSGKRAAQDVLLKFRDQVNGAKELK